MPRPRVYRHDVRCPECGGHWMPKDGTSKGRQVYRCGECHHYHIPEASYHRPSAADKERALAMYKEGSSLSAVARVFGVSAQAVSQWVKRGARGAVSDASAGATAYCWRRWTPARSGDCLR